MVFEDRIKQLLTTHFPKALYDAELYDRLIKIYWAGCSDGQGTGQSKPTTGDKMHPSTEHLLQFFVFMHLPEHLQAVAAPCRTLAIDMVENLPEGPELTAGLRKLLEAKDCFVRAKLAKGADDV